MSELTRLSAHELLRGYRNREFTPTEVVDALARRIQAVEPGLNAFTTLCLERAWCEAEEATAGYARGANMGLLGGVPLAVKDLFDTVGVTTTYGSARFREHVPAADAEAVRRARADGAIVIGKTSTHEFAWGITTVNPHFGPTHNPWAHDRIAGGSSGGSAVALAAHETPLALGSDTGGSIRIPAAFCGIVGLKPTYGRISGAGAFPLAASLDHPGPMGRTPGDVALLLQAIAGVDPRDPTTEDVPLGFARDAVDGGLQGARVAICPDLHRVSLAPDVAAVWERALETIESLGAELVEVGLPEAETIYATFVTVQRAEARYTHEQRGLLDGSTDYGADVAGRLEGAKSVSLTEYLAAAAERRRIRAGFAGLFRGVDLLVSPASAGSPVPIGQETLVHGGREVDFRELVMTYTVPQDLVGLPACALRAGFDELGIPVGIQLTGAPWQEARVIGAATAFFAATPAVQGRWPDDAVLRSTASSGAVRTPRGRSPSGGSDRGVR